MTFHNVDIHEKFLKDQVGVKQKIYIAEKYDFEILR